MANCGAPNPGLLRAEYCSYSAIRRLAVSSDPVFLLNLYHVPQKITETTPCPTVQAGAGQHLRPMAPGDVRATPFQLPDQLHVFIAGQWFEPASALIRLGADAQVGAVDMSMAIAGLITLVIANPCRLIEGAGPLNRDRAAHHVG